MQKLAAKFIQVMQECSHIAKSGTNSYHGYKYATCSDVLQKVNASLTKYGIASFVSPKLVNMQDVKNAKGNIEHLATVEVEITLIDKDSGETAIVRGLGSGQDSADKAVMKGLTASIKYAYMLSLAISTGDDPEADSFTDENNYVEENINEPVNQQQQLPPPRQSPPVQPQQRLKQQPIRNNNLTCYDCGVKISQKVADFSVSKFGRRLCFDCQQAEQAVA